MNKELQFYKAEYKDRIVYYYYTEQNVFISKRCYFYALSIIFGISFIGFKLSSWLCYGVVILNLLSYIDLALAIMWLFIIKFDYKYLQIYSNNVQLLKKVRIEYKDGNVSELTNF